MPQFLENSFLALIIFLVFKCRYLLKFNWFEQKKVHFVYSKQNLRPKNCLLEIGASNLEGPLLKFQYSSIQYLLLLITYLPFGQVSDATNENPRNKRISMIPNRFKGPSILVELLFWIEMSNDCILTQV